MKKLFSNKGMTTTAALLLVTGTVALGTAGGVVGYNVYQVQVSSKHITIKQSTLFCQGFKGGEK